MAVQDDPHLSLVRPVTRTPEGCEDCLVLGSRHAARVTPSNECGRRKTALTLTRRRR